ncbi:gephyrin-like molybdotransferase Glp [Beggiatoa leptomitoformis]|uniref:Molybdopterin molybdenumtransferase n=1 Tax=Beggiatoa leptomitoformis TaxID=288004 RepID=A0A2N9YBX2_9GAMM|nr:gephyrin-like molybdotransferase Glp [Beggiatoa leptomitoformis]ALG66725.1 molybdopterin molybdenumtransferase MoeA [Beggiatoa leptomitoformis]AUI67942.1 molybdopterin molybdenumtransferase MoeA [Beggiatoa leptomitoformis]
MSMEKFVPTPNCTDIFEPDSLSIEQALAQIQMQLMPVKETEKVALRTGLGRILAETIISPVNIPAYTNSAMDGYALHHADLPATGTQTLQVIGTAMAGQPFIHKVEQGQCVRIMTGAILPTGTDTVLMQEHVQREGEFIQFFAGEQAGQNIRHVGEDIRCGEPVLVEGKRLLPPELGLLASLGIAEITVKRRLRVAFFSTGDELRSIGETLEIGQIYDSNRYTLYGMLQRLELDVLDMGVVKDDKQALTHAFTTAAAMADVVITSGGVSVGEADFTKEVLSDLGAINFWKIAMKPGRPFAFGRLQQAAFFGLPGNPVAVMVTFYQLVQPALHYMMSGLTTSYVSLQAKCSVAYKKKPGRAEFPRGLLAKDATGEWTVSVAGQQGSGILSSMSIGNCFILLSIEQGNIDIGEWVTVQPFQGML